MKNDALKKLTDEARKELSARIADKAVTDLVDKTKAASDGDSGSFKVVVSTEDMDRQNEVVKQDGWDLTFYKMNPVVLWAHDYSSLPIGVCTSISLIEGKLVAEGKFAPEDANPFAQQVRRLYDAGIICATSVGFIAKEFDNNNQGQINKAELLEFSFVPVPANPHALTMSMVKNLKLDFSMLTLKGLSFKEAGEGDSCQLDDGTPGVLSADPKDPKGPLICSPLNPGKAAKLPEEGDPYAKAFSTHKDVMTAEHGKHSAAVSETMQNIKDAVKTFKKLVKDGEKSVSMKDASDAIGLLEQVLESANTSIGLETQRHSKECTYAIDKLQKDVADGDDATPPDATLEAAKAIEKAGRAISTKNASVIQEVIDCMKENATKLEGLVTAPADDESGEGKTASKAAAAAEGGKNAVEDGAADRSKSSPADQRLEAFLADKELVKSVSIALGKVLRKHNLMDRVAR